jgi:hypothetical protein
MLKTQIAACALAVPSLASIVDQPALVSRAPAVMSPITFAWTDNYAVRLVPTIGGFADRTARLALWRGFRAHTGCDARRQT